MALRLARAYTGRTKFVKFEDHFHGWHDYVVASPGRPVAGVPDATAQSVVVLQPQISALEQLLARDGDIAAVILEPTGAHYGQLTLMVPQFLKDLRDVTKKYGAVLIMDEVVTGFRLSPGGAQGRFGIEPDLSTLAKIVAGGLPGGVVVGKAEIMDMMAFHDEPDWDGRQRVAHPGTFNAKPVVGGGGRGLPGDDRQPAGQPAGGRHGRPAEKRAQRHPDQDGGARPRPGHGIPDPPDVEKLRLRPGVVHLAPSGDTGGRQSRGHHTIETGHAERRRGHDG